MTDQNQTKKKNSDGINPIAAAVTGAVVGAGFAVAGAVALSDKKNRTKAKQMFVDAKDKATEYLDEMQKKAHSTEVEVENKLAESQKKLDQIKDSAIEAIEQEAKDATKAVRA